MTRHSLALFVTCLLVSGPSFAQEAENKPGDLPGDHFSLQGALEMFRKSESVEAFEQAINTESNSVNNLDLNQDGEIDYVRVISKVSGDAHALILQAVVSEKESQDIAVIDIEKKGDENAELQIVGDEDIYGEQVVIEPSATEETGVLEFNFGDSNPLAGGPNAGYSGDGSQQVFVNVWPWPCVRFIFAPGYRPWVSPWGWRRRPVWFRPWRPFGWSVWQPRCVVYNRGFFVSRGVRVTRAHRVYMPYRTSSVIVRTRYAGPIRQHRVTRVTGPRGNKVIIRDGGRQAPRGRKVKVRRF